MAAEIEEKGDAHHASFDGSDEHTSPSQPKSKDQEAGSPVGYLPQNDEDYVVTLYVRSSDLFM